MHLPRRLVITPIALGLVLFVPSACSSGTAHSTSPSSSTRVGRGRTPCQGTRGADVMEVFMSVNASPDEIAATAAAISASPLVAKTVHLTKEDALVEFRRLFGKDQPNLVATITAEELPESFQVTPAPKVIRSDVTNAFAPLAGVQSVETGPRACR